MTTQTTVTTQATVTFGDKLKMQYAMLPIRAINLLLTLLYRFRIEGKENVPKDGPVIILYSEPSLLTTLLEAAVTPTFFGKLYLDGKVLNLVGEELWSIEFFRKNFDSVAPTVPSQPHGGGLLGLGLLEGLEAAAAGDEVLDPDLGLIEFAVGRGQIVHQRPGLVREPPKVRVLHVEGIHLVLGRLKLGPGGLQLGGEGVDLLNRAGLEVGVFGRDGPVPVEPPQVGGDQADNQHRDGGEDNPTAQLRRGAHEAGAPLDLRDLLFKVHGPVPRR